MKQKGEQLESYPLARAYKWCLPKADTGGVLYLFPPMTNRAGRKRADGTKRRPTVVRARLESIHPHDLSIMARELAERWYSKDTIDGLP